MDVRRAVDSDWRSSRAIRLQALRDAPLAFASTSAREEAFGDEVWRSRIADSAQFLAFAPSTISGEAVIGTGTGFVDPAHPGEVRLVAMFVVPAARGRGVASRLLDAVVTDARERGFDRVVLDVVESNAAAHRCYVRYGFRPTGATRPLPHAPELTEIEMELRLG
jgi:ribosomal protein S18 acetylase RimI-like enzyme